jgi:hypothetical protein
LKNKSVFLKKDFDNSSYSRMMSYMRMNHEDHGPLKRDDQSPRTTTPKSLGTATRLLAFCGVESPKDQAMRPVRNLNARDQIDAAIDQWAESLLAIIEASDNPEASLLRAHLTIAHKHKELETMAWRELETRRQPSGVAHG